MSKFPQFYNKIFDYSLKRTTHVKFADILNSMSISHKNRVAISSKYIHSEMPIRMANRVTDLNNLPFGLTKNHSVNKVREWYLMSFLDLVESNEPKNESEIKVFAHTVEQIFNRHAPTLMTMSKGIYELKQENKMNEQDTPKIQTFLNRFYTNRTEMRILLEQYLSLFKPTRSPKYFGIVNLNSNPITIIKQAIEDIQYICNKHYFNIDLSDVISIHSTNPELVMPCIDHYLYYILVEIIKNSVQTVIDKQQQRKANTKYNPQIGIRISEIDEKWMLIKIQDNGMGIKPEDMDKIWHYNFSTSKINERDIQTSDNAVDFSLQAPLSGFGYGLPISDVYMNFFNSSTNCIKVDSTLGEGTAIYLFLTKHKIKI